MEYSTVSLLEDATLPPPWKALEDDSTGLVYYWNSETNCTQWSKPGGGKGKRRQRRRRRKGPVTPNAPENQQAAAATVPQEAQVAASSSSSVAPPSDGAGCFTKVLQITGEDGGLGVLGEYHVRSDLYDTFPRYEKAGVDPKNRKERRFLTHFNVGQGRWVVSDWEEALLLGPVADKRTAPKAPEHYKGEYEVCRDVKCRCKGVVKIEVTPVEDESKLVMHSSPLAKKAQELDEDARAVRKRFHEQMNDAVQDGAFEDSDTDIPFEFPCAGQEMLCEHCGKKGKFKCSRCNFTYYCSESHQAAHRAKHQKVCEQLDGVNLTRQMEEMLRWVGPVDSDDECAKDPFKTSAFDLRCLLAAGEKFGQPDDGDDDDDDGVDCAGSFTKVLQITGEDGDLGILGEYHLRSDLYDTFPRYEKACVDPKNRKERRFLTHFNVGPGRWVVSDWEEVLLLGPLAGKRTAPKAPEHYKGEYEVCRDVKCRCKSVVKIKVAPVKDESKLATTSTPSAKDAQELDEDARAVRKRFHEQMNDAVQDGTFEGSDSDIPFAFPWAGQVKKLCEHCGKKGKFKCSRCNFTYYCSESHQAAHRAKHQRVCEQLDGVKLTRQMEEMLRWVGPPDSDDDGDDDDDPYGFGVDPYDEDMIMSRFGMSGFEFRSLNGGLYTMDQRYQGSYEDAMNAIDFCPDADDPRFWF